ncbi:MULTISPECIES: hypothetical protein [Rhizobium]|uniref:Terminase small subunit n=1 Tax=Rhizobium rhododendri TaxID=2506430 RepID=A0ABY8IJN2_9HYPH|nr:MULTISPECIES: hypothetical protein [Rhizobium]MBZ5761698.1 hypothetical protein [Rhizobium sp. VS19-DR96]MBZ5767794.1 hypothetical protein [Rhizobium sp. VS19-DR129.2]MBZ5773680.1 hypothetical protein [Rhizobium sp. VS19-DRK62.2]MBZ5786411.1 hypothetical protein [Rhizobium sp. VS19-DR121]MBZ5802164.1 hypothetical protein [Rhizobium sp. VS19-DR181]
MHEFEGFDPGLFGYWPNALAYRGCDIGWGANECLRQAEACLLEIKSGSAEDVLRTLLNEMTVEMRAEFDYFKGLRSAAEASGKAFAEGTGDEAAAKLARADVKLSVDAMSLIVRTLEKIDGLQRQMARDRETEIERHADGPGYVENKRRLLAIIEQRAEDRARAIVAERDLQRANPGLDPAATATGPPQGDPPAAEADAVF